MSMALQLKISLAEVKPEIWRRFLAEDSISFHQLHSIIQKVMGWENYHLYRFEFGNTFIEPDEYGRAYVDSIWTMFKPAAGKAISPRAKLNTLIKEEKQKFGYTYDFGDSWEHSVVVEKILEKGPAQEYQICLAGERSCPPEDCGGVHGYADLLKVRANKNHPDYKDLIINWLGKDFDPEKFDIDEVNKKLRN